VDTARTQNKKATKDHLKEMWTAGFRYNWRKMETELDGDKWSVAYDPMRATKH